jgi:hypothetical protein
VLHGCVGVTGRIVVQGRVPTALRRWGGALGTDAGQRQRTQVKISSACVAIAPVGARAFHFEQALPLVVRDARIHLVSTAVCVWSHLPPVTSEGPHNVFALLAHWGGGGGAVFAALAMLYTEGARLMQRALARMRQPMVMTNDLLAVSCWRRRSVALNTARPSIYVLCLRRVGA